MKSSESGTTIMEVMAASFFLTIALLAAAMSMLRGMSYLYISQEQLVAKQKAQETMESVIMARNTQQIGFSQILNTSDGGIFVTGFEPLVDMGIDGIPNTADDGTTVETITFPGPDGDLGTADDVTISLTNYTRQITISTIPLAGDTSITDPDIRRIDVDVQYVDQNGIRRTTRVTSMVSRYS